MFILTAILLVNIILLCYTCFMRYKKLMWEHYLDHHGMDPSMFEQPKSTHFTHQTQTQTYDYESDTEPESEPEDVLHTHTKSD